MKKKQSENEQLIRRFLNGELTPRQESELDRRLVSDAALMEQLRSYSVDLPLWRCAGKPPEESEIEALKREMFASFERKVLLDGPPRRRRWPSRLAVAGILLLMSVAAVFWTRAIGTAQAVVSSVVLGQSAPSEVPPEFFVTWSVPEEPASLSRVASPSAHPSGTVVVSVGKLAEPAKDRRFTVSIDGQKPI